MKIALFHNLPPGGGRKFVFETLKILSKKHTFDFYGLDFFKDNKYKIKSFCRNYQTFRVDYNTQKNFLNYLQFVFIKLPIIQKKIATIINKKN